MLTEQLLAEINTLKDEIKNLNGIITVAQNSANASQLRAIEYQSQRDTLAEAIEFSLSLSLASGESENALRSALAAVKGGEA